VVWVLQQNLVASCEFQLLDFEGHLADAAASILEPKRVRSQITIQIVLFAVGFEKLSLCEEIVVGFHFVIHIYFVLVLDKFTLAVTR
jgi:hypothetical protein